MQRAAWTFVSSSLSGLHELAPMLHALGDRRVFALRPLEFEKASNLAHSRSLSAALEPAGS